MAKDIQDLQSLSPEWMVERIDHFSATLVARVAKICQDRLATAAIFFLGALFLDFIVREMSGGVLRETGMMRLLLNRSLPCAAGLFALGAIIDPKLRMQAWFRGLAALILVGIVYFSSGSPASLNKFFLTQLALLGGLLALSWTFCVFSRPFGRRSQVAVLFFATALAGLLPELVRQFCQSPFLAFSPIHAVLMLTPLFFEDMTNRQELRFQPERLTHAITPLTLISPLPLWTSYLPEAKEPDSAVSGDDARISSEVVCSLFGAGLAAIVALFLARCVPTELRMSRPIYRIDIGFLIYLFFYFFWLSISRCGYACGRFLGYRFPKPTACALLAADPLDRWRRWNVIFFNWYRTCIFFPISRASGSVVLGLAGVFFVDIIIHNSPILGRILLAPSSLADGHIIYATGQVEFYLAHAVVLFIGLRWKRAFPSMRGRSGWLGVALTTFLMSLVHGFVKM